MAEKRPFPWALCLMLMGTYILLIGDVIVEIIRYFNPTFFTAWVALLTLGAVFVQVPGVIWALILFWQASYRTWMNLALTILGAVPPLFIIWRVMTVEGRFHI